MCHSLVSLSSPLGWGNEAKDPDINQIAFRRIGSPGPL